MTHGDEITFGPGAGGSWDQFAANEEKFGITTKFDENVYTTKLDRSGKDFREREKAAERIAAEITGVSNSIVFLLLSLFFFSDPAGSISLTFLWW